VRGDLPLDTTAELIRRVRGGDASAENELVSRYIPLLQRWAHGRLPSASRDLAETDDLVQVSILRALQRLPEFECRREGAFLAYLRAIVLNAIREEYRRGATRHRIEGQLAQSEEEPLASSDLPGRDPTLRTYEAALERLSERQREAVILRLEFDYSYAQIASAIGSPTEDGARMTVKRALVRLAKEIQALDPSAPGEQGDAEGIE